MPDAFVLLLFPKLCGHNGVLVILVLYVVSLVILVSGVLIANCGVSGVVSWQLWPWCSGDRPEYKKQHGWFGHNHK